MNLNFHIHAYGDLDHAKQAIASLPAGTPVHVFDGRYATFAGDHDLTPGLEAFCGAHPDCRYHAPPPGALPFGHDLDVPDEWRPGNYAKARWAFDHLSADEWTLKLDTDERLRTFEADLDALSRTHKYAPVVDLHGQAKQSVHIARLWVPDAWTPWINDCLLPRDVFPRDHPLEALQRVWRDDEWTALRFLRRGQLTAIEIDNYGGERPAAYQRRRAEHLRRIGRDDRWTELKREIGT